MATQTTVNCKQCSTPFKAKNSEIKRGGGKFCNRHCWLSYQKHNHPSGQDWYAWKGDRVGKEALHNWVQKHKGRPKQCETCLSTNKKKYEWANISQKYRRDLSDWIRLCTECHMQQDRLSRLRKYRKWQRSVGMKVTPIKELNAKYYARKRAKERATEMSEN